jgi:hypothetical protein
VQEIIDSTEARIPDFSNVVSSEDKFAFSQAFLKIISCKPNWAHIREGVSHCLDQWERV